MRELDGKVAIVTGASRGVGKAIASALAGEGGAVVLVARSEEGLAASAEDIRRSGGRCAYVVGDVSSPEDMRRAVLKAREEYGGLDALINNAGIGGSGSVEDLPLEEWRAVLDTNLTGAFVASQAAIPALRARGGGHIISIGSGAGKRGYANMSAYCASKFGLHGLMQSLAEEVGELGIKVSVINPGSILTDFGGGRDRRREGKHLIPEDVAEGVLYLLSQPGRAWTQEMNLWPFR